VANIACSLAPTLACGQVCHCLIRDTFIQSIPVAAYVSLFFYCHSYHGLLIHTKYIHTLPWNKPTCKSHHTFICCMNHRVWISATHCSTRALLHESFVCFMKLRCVCVRGLGRARAPWQGLVRSCVEKDDCLADKGDGKKVRPVAADIMPQHSRTCVGFPSVQPESCLHCCSHAKATLHIILAHSSCLSTGPINDTQWHA
jgi:hypothetical protein